MSSDKKSSKKPAERAIKKSGGNSTSSSPSGSPAMGKGAYLALSILRGDELHANDARGTSDPYVKFEIASHSKKTKRVNHTVNPEWNETFVIHFKSDNWDTQDILFSVFDHDRISKDDLLGTTKYSLAGLKSIVGTDEVKVMQYKLGGTKKAKGSLTFAISAYPNAIDKDKAGAKHKAAFKTGKIEKKNEANTTEASLGKSGETAAPAPEKKSSSKKNKKPAKGEEESDGESSSEESEGNSVSSDSLPR